MRLTCLLAVLICVASASGASALATSAAPAPYRNPTVGRDVALQLPDMHRARVTRNLVFRRSADGPLRLDAYAPRRSKAGSRLPAVLFVHGSTSDPSPKDWGAYVGWGQLAAASGLVGITFNHRVASTLDDTRAAIDFVRKNARRLGVDSQRIAVQTHSAGAPEGVVAALVESPTYIRCVVVYYGALSASLPRLSPLAQLKARPEKIPPMLIAKAGLDDSTLNRSIAEFAAAAAARKAPVTVIAYPQGQHAFDVLQHTSRSRQIMRATLAFLREKLRT